MSDNGSGMPISFGSPALVERFVAGPAGGGKMDYQRKRDEREHKYDTDLLGDLANPMSFVEAAVARIDPGEKAASMGKQLDVAVREVLSEAAGMLVDAKAAIDEANGRAEKAEAKTAEAEAAATEAKAATASAVAALASSGAASQLSLKKVKSSAVKSSAAKKREKKKKDAKIRASRDDLESSSSNGTSSLSGRRLTAVTKAVEDQILLASSGSELDFCLVVKSFLKRPICLKMVDIADQVRCAALDTAIVDRLAAALKILKRGCNNEESRIAYEAVLIAVAPSANDPLSGFSGRLGVQRRTLRDRQEQRSAIDEAKATAVWFHKDVAPNCRTFKNKPEFAQMEQWWETNTKVTNINPSVSSKVVKHSGGRCWHKGDCGAGCQSHVRHDLQMTLGDAFLEFKGDKPDLVAAGCNRTVFYSLVPYWVKEPKGSTCNCIYHSQAHLIISCYRHVMIEAHKNCACDCEFCGGGAKCAAELDVLSSQSIFEGALCPREEAETGGEHHKAKCVRRTCASCGPSASALFPLLQLTKCPLANSPATAKYKIITTEKKTVSTVDDEGFQESKDVSTTIKKSVESSHAEFTQLLEEHLVGYSAHRHVANFQAEQFDAMVDRLKDTPGHCIMLMDYGMNYSHVHPDETQGEFWTHVQTTVLPIVVYRLIGGRVWAESYVFLSDDLKHDNDFVRHCVGVLVKNMKDDGVAVDTIHFWSDGCACQFKLKKEMFFVSQPEIFLPDGAKHTVVMSHHFFCSCHGKGPSDAETAVTKSLGRGMENHGTYMAYPIDFFEGVKQKLEGLSEPKLTAKHRHSLKKRRVLFVERSSVTRVSVEFDGLTDEVKGNHSFKGVDRLGTIKRQWLSCACSGCFSLTPSACKQPQFNEEEKLDDISMKRHANTKDLDTRLTERSSKLWSRMSRSKNSGVGSLVALYQNNPSDEHQWSLAEVAEPARKRRKKDVIHSEEQRAGSTEDKDMVAKVFAYESMDDPEGKGRRLFHKPPGEKCDKERHECQCEKWHAELEHAVSVRPPIVDFKQAKKQLHAVPGLDDAMVLDATSAQKVDECCDADEAFQQENTTGYLPTYKKIRIVSSA